MWYVEHKGHRWGIMAADFRSEADAVKNARETCKDATLTTVYDCTMGPVGRIVLQLNRDGSEV